MITVINAGRTVQISVNLFGWQVNFNQEKEDGLVAILLAKAISDKMNNTLEMIRREAYMKGYHDGRTKLKKETDFEQGW